MTEPPDKRQARLDPRVAQYRLLARLFDSVFRIPGTKWRFGLDALIGLIPGIGDVAGAFVGAYGVWLARRLGAPSSVQARMLLNLGIDAVVGAVPFLGDLFDFGFKAHARNQALLEDWLSSPTPTRRSSSAMLLGIGLALLAIVAGTLWLAFLGLRWLYEALTG